MVPSGAKSDTQRSVVHRLSQEIHKRQAKRKGAQELPRQHSERAAQGLSQLIRVLTISEFEGRTCNSTGQNSSQQ